MKLTVFSSYKNNRHVQELKKTCKKFGVGFQQLEKITNPNDLNPKNVGDVIFLRKFSLNVDQTSFILESLKDKVLINRTLLNKPHIKYKYYQQKYISLHTHVTTIPTYVANTEEELKKLINEGRLNYPIMQKLNYGSHGIGAKLIKTPQDISGDGIENYVFQNFIPNNGDFRVLVCGGRVVGMFKKIAKDGHFLNNASQGGRVESVKDASIIKEISSIAIEVATAFDLVFCGVDVIHNETTGTYHFMEVNTLTERQLFQTTFKINISNIILETAIQLYDRSQKKKTYDLVKNYYDQNIDNLGKNSFHYLTRMFFRTKEKKYLQGINDMKSTYIGGNELNIRNKIEQLYNLSGTDVGLLKETRLPYLKKYKKLRPINNILFRYLFTKLLYKKDIKHIINEFLSDKELMDTIHKLYKDQKSISILSTHAINLFYNASYYLGKNMVNPKYIYTIGQKHYDLTNKEHVALKIYLYTHCIIGASNFYSKKITKDLSIYKKMLQDLEQLIHENYFDIMLDPKLEFLVCCNMLGYTTNLKKIILGEAEKSLSPIGNFIIDTVNTESQSKKDFVGSEHRNVLYLIANKKYPPTK